MLRIFFLTLTIFSFTILFVGCGGSSSEPEHLVQNYLETNSSSDSNTTDNTVSDNGTAPEPPLEIMSINPNLTGYYRVWPKSLTASSDYYEFEMTKGKKYRILLRVNAGDANLFAYNSADMRDENLTAFSMNTGFNNDSFIVDAHKDMTLFLKVSSNDSSIYVLYVNIIEPYLEKGFPVEVLSLAGTYDANPNYDMVVVGNIDDDPELEILTSALTRGPVYAWNHDASAVEHFPETQSEGPGYVSIGEFDHNISSHEVSFGSGPFYESCKNNRYILDHAGNVMPGWPLTNCSAGSSAPILKDIDNDGVDELFFRDAAYYVDGTPIDWWDNIDSVYNDFHVIDWDGDGIVEVISKNFSDIPELNVQETNGSVLSGFPASLDVDNLNTVDGGRSAIGDINHDEKFDIVVARKVQANPSWVVVYAIANDGTLLWRHETTDGMGWTTQIALGDLNDDGVPEIILQTASSLYVWQGDGSAFDGWPVTTTSEIPTTETLSPIIADVTGDGKQNIVVTANDYLKIYDSHGVLLHNIRVEKITKPHVVADIDLDGRNEIIVAGNPWNGTVEYRDNVWVFDLNGSSYGGIEWGQPGKDAKHNGVYE